MDIQFLGTGGAFDYQYNNSAAIVNIWGQKILIDCGHSIYPVIRQQNALENIQQVLITHTHDDHIGSLSTLAAHLQIFGQRKLVLLWPEEHFLNELKNLFQYTLQNVDKYLDFKPIEAATGVNYINTYGQHAENLQSYAYYFEEESRRIVYSGDLGNCKPLFDALDNLPKMETTVFHDITFNKKAVAHAYYKDLMAFGNRYKVYGYHCDPQKNPDDNTIPLVEQHPQFLYRTARSLHHI